jgi:16S rRNA processing protein RimM
VNNSEIPSTQAQDVVIVGRIGGVYGVNGWLRVSSFTEPRDNLLTYQPWMLEQGDGWRTHPPTAVKPHGQGFIAQFPGINDRDGAARLTGKHIAVARAALPTPEEGEYYWRDLEGLTVWQRGEALGVVQYLLDTGASPVLVVRGEAREVLIPFVDAHVENVDLAQGRIDVNWDEAD